MSTPKDRVDDNWVSRELIGKVFAAALLFVLADGALWALFKGWLALKLLLALPGVFFLVFGAYLCWARHAFQAGGVQEKIMGLLMERIQWDGLGRALDIGCGAGPLTVRLAQRYPQARITGLDYWGGSWGYSMAICQRRCESAGVGQRTDFVRGSAASLPFESGSFDLAVSSLTFHEVRGEMNKRPLVQEALRVVKEGSPFVFADLFRLRSCYGDMEDFVRELQAAGIREVRYEDAGAAPFIPRGLRLPFMVGALGILYGVK